MRFFTSGSYPRFHFVLLCLSLLVLTAGIGMIGIALSNSDSASPGTTTDPQTTLQPTNTGVTGSHTTDSQPSDASTTESITTISQPTDASTTESASTNAQSTDASTTVSSQETTAASSSRQPISSEESLALSYLSSMTLEEKAAQMFFVRCPASDAASFAAKYNPGGYILFARDFEHETVSSVTKTIQSYQDAVKIPLLIGVDEEGGTVTRISRYSAFRNERFASPRDLFSAGGLDRVRQDTLEKCALLTSLGINVNLAPVCDLSNSPKDFIYSRALSDNPKTVSDYVSLVVSTMNEQGMGCALKHFPGYGNNVDTHTGIAIDNRPLATFQEKDFLPFLAGIDAGAGSILVSHNIVTCMDDTYPASLSPAVHTILRETLGFTGVIMTDDLIMDAITQYTDGRAAAVLAVLAGNDLLICSDLETQLPAVIEAVQNGVIPEEQLNESVLRILTWKIRLNLIS